MMRSTVLTTLALTSVLGFGFVLHGCYLPSPQDNSFTCSPGFNNICPVGFACNPSGFCTHTGAGDFSSNAFDLAAPISDAAMARTCDDKVQAGAFSNLVALTNINTAADESHIAYDAKGNRLLFMRGGQLFSSDATNKKAPAAPVAVTVMGGPTTFNGGSFTYPDGHYWFSGTTGGSTSLYDGAPSGATFTATVHANPTAPSCPFFDPTFTTNDSANSLLFSYALASCTGPSYIVTSAADQFLTASYSTLDGPGWAQPNLTPTALTLVVSSTGTAPRLNLATRTSTTFTFGSATPLPMTGLGGAGTQDVQLIVTNDCSVAYLVSQRTGGAGGLDVFAADIAAE